MARPYRLAPPPAPAPPPGPRTLTPLQRAGDVGVTVLMIIRRLVLTLGIGMVAFSLLPAAFGWTTSVVISGSMAPAVRVGDVVAAAPVPLEKVGTLPRGTVLLMDDPAKPGKLLLHRLVLHRSDGTLVTRGDANDRNDSTPVPPEKVKGVARLRVPMIGLPVYWAQNREWAPLAACLVLLSIIVLWQPRRPTPH